MVDIHCHMLPGVDDGASSWEVAQRMAEMAIADGITHTVCTPHANDDHHFDRAAHKELLARFADSLSGRLQLSLGCDFHFSFENVQALLASPDQFLITGSDYLLVEFSDFALPPRTKETLQRLVEAGITPVITHPERNLWLSQRRELLLDFLVCGCITQITANSLTGFWGHPARATAEWLLEREAVHVVATDAHDLRRRPPVLSKARTWIAERYGHFRAEALTLTNPLAIVENRALPYLPVPVAR